MVQPAPGNPESIKGKGQNSFLVTHTAYTEIWSLHLTHP